MASNSPLRFIIVTRKGKDGSNRLFLLAKIEKKIAMNEKKVAVK